LEDAVRMCRLAAEDGCPTLVATPHQRHDRWWNGEPGELERLRARLQDALGGEPRVLLGAEIRVGEGLLEALDEGRAGGVVPLAGSRYLLLELSRVVPDPDPAGLVHELTVAGWHPILAHVEEIRWLAGDLEQIRELVARGATLQVTGSNLLGHRGGSVQGRARRLLDEGLVHFLASDGHHPDTRPPGLAPAWTAVARHWGEEVAELLTEINPRAVIEDRELPPIEALDEASAN
ncbi:MAG: tyrosine-protein phosphatase, partial [Acidobacteriota bacterium]